MNVSFWMQLKYLCDGRFIGAMIVLSCSWMIRGLSPGRGCEFFSSHLHPDWFWEPPSLLSNGYQGFFPWG